MSYCLNLELNLDDSIIRRLETCRKNNVDMNTIMAITKLYDYYGDILPIIYSNWLEEQRFSENIVLEGFSDFVRDYVSINKPGLAVEEALKQIDIPWSKLAKVFFEFKELGTQRFFDKPEALLKAFFKEYDHNLAKKEVRHETD